MATSINTLDFTAPILAPARPEPTEADLVARARDFIPELRGLDAEAEQLGRAPEAIIERFREARFFDMLKPRAYGGLEVSPGTALEVIRTLARGSASIAWSAALLIIHNWEIALADPRVAETIWTENPEALLSSSYAPFGKAEKVPGGYIVSGNWAWSSACDHAQWAVLGVNFPADNQFGVDQKVMIIPRTEYEIDQESWKMAGMMGTGSKTVRVRDAFVPDWRVHNTLESYEGACPGWDTFTSSIYRVPFGALFALSLATLCTGAAQGALDVYTDTLKTKRHAYSGAEMKKNHFALEKLGQASAMVHAAVAIAEKEYADLAAEIAENGYPSKERRIATKNNAAFAARLACDAVTLLIKAAGGSAFALSHPLQRIFRDVHTGSNHAFINPEAGAMNYGWFLASGQIDDFVI